MWFVEMTEQDLKDGMDYGYWVQAWTVYVSIPFVKARKLTHICAGSHEDDGEAEQKRREDLYGVLDAGIHDFCWLRVVRPSKACSARYVAQQTGLDVC